MSMERYTLVHYVRGVGGVPHGVLVAVRRPDGVVAVDYSLCNMKLDRFTKQRALEIAIGRAMGDRGVDRVLPRSLRGSIDSFNDRVMRYYRVGIGEVLTWSSETLRSI